MKVARKLYELRTQKDMTQTDIAKIAGVSHKSVSAWESCTREPKLRSIRKICAYFDLDFNSFVDESLDDLIPAYKQKDISKSCSTIPEIVQPIVSDRLSPEAIKIAVAYDKATAKEQRIVRLTLSDYLSEDDGFIPVRIAARSNDGRPTDFSKANLNADIPDFNDGPPIP